VSAPPVKAAQVHLLEALEREGEAQRALLDGDEATAASRFREVADLYRRSWELAPPNAYGRLAGMLKAAILAGGGEEEARFARAEAGSAATPASAYVVALAALVTGDDEAAGAAAEAMEEGDPPFRRAAAAISAIASGDPERYAEALAEILRDFETRESHLTGVPIADTALVLELLAGRRGMASGLESDLLP
jgi:hypothetical protein